MHIDFEFHNKFCEIYHNEINRSISILFIPLNKHCPCSISDLLSNKVLTTKVHSNHLQPRQFHIAYRSKKFWKPLQWRNGKKYSLRAARVLLTQYHLNINTIILATSLLSPKSKYRILKGWNLKDFFKFEFDMKELTLKHSLFRVKNTVLYCLH